MNVLLRMFKKSLFLLVDTSVELFRSYSWDEVRVNLDNSGTD